MDFEFIYKICTIEEWEKAKSQDKFFGSKKDLEDGKARERVVSINENGGISFRGEAQKQLRKY